MTATPDATTPPLVIRPAELADLDICLTLDPSYVTEAVWQMELQRDQDRTAVSFRAIKLPRSMGVRYPRDRDQLIAQWKQCDGFLVAVRQGRIVGYAALSAQAAEDAAWIKDLVIERGQRRQGVGTTLLEQACTWARSRGLRRLLAEAQTKNYPAICWCERNGLAFCGFNDRYYANQDIAVFFARNLR